MNFISRYWKRLTPRNRAIVGTGFVLILIGLYFVFHKAPVADTADVALSREVSVKSITELAGGSSSLPVVGQVSSVSEADIRSESAGSITSLNHTLGQYVSAGASIASIENSSQRAAVLQAQGALQSAQANLDKVTNGTRTEQLDISQTTTAKAQTNLSQTMNSTVDTIKSIYGTNDDAIRAKIDVVFSNPRGANVQFNMNTSNQSFVNKIVNDRPTIESILNAESDRAASLSASSDLSAELARAADDARKLKIFVDDVAAALNIAIPSQSFPQSTISGYITSTSAVRSSLSGSLSTLSAAASALTAAQAQVSVSQTQLQQDTSGSRKEDEAVARAGVTQAQGAYNAALANLEKTIIRSPISGTINNLTIKRGDFVSAFQQVAVVSNNGALEVVTAVTADDRATIAVGNKALIEGEYKGIVTKVAPAIDPISKKIEVHIGFVDAVPLTNGESVRVDISRTVAPQSKTSTTFRIPLSAVKVSTEGAVVFTVDAQNTLVTHTVTTGDLFGDTIEITGGIDESASIVTDARGLKAGQTVTVK